MKYIAILCLLAAKSLVADDYVTGQNQFGFELYNKIGDGKENCCLSPYSIGNALALAYAGADGETKSEIDTLLSYPAGDVFKEISALKAYLAPAVSSAEAVAIDVNFHPLKGYLDTVQKKLGSEVFEINTNVSTNDAILRVNQWVSLKTKGFITSLLKPNDITKATKMVLLNAVYVKALWTSPFRENETKNDLFYTAEHAVVSVPMMHKKEMMKLYQDDSYFVVWQDMRQESSNGPQLETVIILPRIEVARSSSLTQEQLAAWERQAKRQYVELFMPKCSLRKQSRLKQPLQALGMKEAFTNNANFSLIHTHDALKVGDVIHEAFMQIDEAGIEAAGATAVTMMAMSAWQRENEPTVVRCDAPFFVLIREKKSELVLFISYIATPEKIVVRS
jgi:serpin B